eukprot:CCRYP_006887-RA/>CCRYP_006887-RA protein AED:0.47 eAED:0.47 QI:0/-1/0/1/-1/1/1/0/123
MYSMIATAPESIQQRRRLQSRDTSPKVTPTKTPRTHAHHPRANVVRYGAHSPVPTQGTGTSPSLTRERRRYSHDGVDVATALGCDASSEDAVGVGLWEWFVGWGAVAAGDDGSSCYVGERKLP